jgi:hypothetical protein
MARLRNGKILPKASLWGGLRGSGYGLRVAGCGLRVCPCLNKVDGVVPPPTPPVIHRDRLHEGDIRILEEGLISIKKTFSPKPRSMVLMCESVEVTVDIFTRHFESAYATTCAKASVVRKASMPSPR